jgi:hypothetical protein
MVELAAESAKGRNARCIRLELRDFSLGGMRGSSLTLLCSQEQVTVSMPPLGTRALIRLTGRVIRCQREGDRFDVGIEFGQIRTSPESTPWLRMAALFCMAGSTPKCIG